MLNAPNNVFSLWVPLEVEKAEDGAATARIRGIASSEAKDTDGEIVEQAGLDWTPFLKSGYITLEHPFQVPTIIGYPNKVEPVKVGDIAATQIDADLMLDKDLGKQVYQTAMALKKAGNKRRLGFSIEGSALPGHRKDGRVTKAIVRHVVVSHAPKNPLAWFEPIMASMLAGNFSPNWFGRAESMGYPAQGQAASGAGGIEKLVTQSIQGKKPSYAQRITEGMSTTDLLTARLLRGLPHLTWAQGQAVIKDLKLKKR